MTSKNSGSASRWFLLLLVIVAVAALTLRLTGLELLLPGSAPGSAVLSTNSPGASAETTQAGLALTEVREPAAATQAHLDPDQVRVIRDRAFISYAFPVLSTWDMAALRPLLSAETVAGNSDEQLGEVMTVLSNRLGKLQYFETPQPASAESSGLQVSESADLHLYRFTAYYEAGAAEVDLVLHEQRDASSLYSFNIQVPN